MNSIFFIGDFAGDNGPAIANRALISGFDNKGIAYTKRIGKVARILEILWGVCRSRHICLCSSSKSNVISIILARILNRDIVYIMHGFLSYEARVNGGNELKCKRFEHYIFNKVRRIICVSPLCAEYIKEVFPEYKEKITFIYNAVSLDEEEIQRAMNSVGENVRTNQDSFSVISLGGGMPQKKNDKVAQAIKILYDEGLTIDYTIIGKSYEKKDELVSYPFVKFIESVPHENVLARMRESDLYIQNSAFETFGIAPIEAMLMGCSLLLSAKMGCLSVFSNYPDEYLIYDVDDYQDIAQKIKSVILTPNNGELLGKANLNLFSPQNVVKRLETIIYEK